MWSPKSVFLVNILIDTAYETNSHDNSAPSIDFSWQSIFRVTLGLHYFSLLPWWYKVVNWTEDSTPFVGGINSLLKNPAPKFGGPICDSTM